MGLTEYWSIIMRLYSGYHLNDFRTGSVLHTAIDTLEDPD